MIVDVTRMMVVDVTRMRAHNVTLMRVVEVSLRSTLKRGVDVSRIRKKLINPIHTW